MVDADHCEVAVDVAGEHRKAHMFLMRLMSPWDQAFIGDGLLLGR